MLFFVEITIYIMRTKVLLLMMLVPMFALAQIKGKKSKSPYKTSKGTEFKVGQIIKLGKPSNGETFAFAYVKKSGLSLGNIAKAARTINSARNMNVSNVRNIANTVDQVNNLANSELVSSAMNQLMGQAVSADYVEKNALSSEMENAKFKIKQFKIYTDKDTGDQIVHAIAKGGGKNVAILLDFAEKTGELAE